MSLSSLMSMGYYTLNSQFIDSNSIPVVTQRTIQTGVTLLSTGGNGGLPIGFSKNGQSIVYVNKDKQVMISTNYGVSFKRVADTTLTSIAQVAISNDGVYILLGQTNNSPGSENLMRSVNTGSSWSSCSFQAFSVAMSSSGQYQVATTNSPLGNIRVSKNYGADWSTKATGVGAVVCSINSTGEYIVTSVNASLFYYNYSTNYGDNWTQIKTNYGPSYAGRNVAISNDGKTFVANGLFQYSVANSSISRDAGTTTIFSSNDVQPKTNNATMQTQAINGNGNDVYFLSLGILLKSSDNLQSFSQVGTSTVSFATGANGFIYASANCKYILSYYGSTLHDTAGALWLTTNNTITEI